MLKKTTDAIQRLISKRSQAEKDEIGDFGIDMSDYADEMDFSKYTEPTSAEHQRDINELNDAIRAAESISHNGSKNGFNSANDAQHIESGVQRMQKKPEFRELGLPARRVEHLDDDDTYTAVELKRYVFDSGDVGNAQRLYVTCGNRYRFVPEISTWYEYTDGFWRECSAKEQETAMLLVAENVKNVEMPFYRPTDKDDERGKAEYSYAQSVYKSLCNTAQRANALKSAEQLPAFKISQNELDKNPWLFNFKNGTLDTKTMSFKEHDANDYISRQSPINYNINAQKPERWLKFLDECMMGDTEMILRLQKVWGLSLCRALMHREQYMFIHTGSGSNGKSTAFQTLSKIFGTSADGGDGRGSYSTMISPNTFIQSKKPDDGSGAQPQLLALKGSHMNLVSELPQNCMWNEALIKAITGKDAIVARNLYSGSIKTYQVDGFLHFLTNHVPKIDSSNFSMIRRLQMILWPASFTGDQIDTSLPEKLMDEAEGIVQWLVEGLKLYQTDLENGTDLRHMPKASKNEIAKFLHSIDLIAQFCDSCIIETDNDISEVSSTDAFNLFLEWMQASNILYNKPIKRVFTEKMLARGYANKRTKHGTTFLKIKLNYNYD